MSKAILEIIDNAYKLILQPLDIMYKKEQINNYKVKLGISKDETFGSAYYDYISFNKKSGVVYTPFQISKYMIENTITDLDIINNPFIKILDPACGCGNILIPCFKYLKNIYLKNLTEINAANNLSLSEENIAIHIIDNNLHGTDIDMYSIKVLALDLFNESEYVNEKNLYAIDFLVEFEEDKFDVIIGNPPYIGHKSVDREYSRRLKSDYKNIYKDKGDISYCFFIKSFEILKPYGKVSFITSRYFMEAQSSKELRKVITERTSIIKIVDFYGIRPFKNAGIDPLIIFLESGTKSTKTSIIRPLATRRDSKKSFYNSVFLNEGKNYSSFYMNSVDFNSSGWVLVNDIDKKILEKIKKGCSATLSDMCNSFQGIITGCDRAFVVDHSTIMEEMLEKELIRPWIKSSDIESGRILESDKYLIYSNLIKDESKYTSCLNHVSKYRSILEQRRECKKGIRMWYELQWGRKEEIFEARKIVFPYKSTSNRFAIDEGSYFSADVYSLVIKDEGLSYEWLMNLLNSSLYEFYFKTYAKKLGDALYEYYPNTVMRLGIPESQNLKFTDDNSIFDYFSIDTEEIDYIKNKLS
jgi:adenine-specific DNA-methyltransferase